MKIILATLLGLTGIAGTAMATDIYDTLPSPLPPNVPSLGYEATSAAEFGDLIQFAGVDRSLQSVTVAMSNWAYESQYETIGTSAGFTIDLTLNLYGVGAGDAVGPLLGTQTVDALIPWRPEPDPADCAPGSNNDYMGSDGQCYAGSLSTVSFNFGGLNLPNQVIYGLAFNTETAGYNPTGTPGPYDSLNFALATVPPTVGSNPLPDTAYWNTSYGGFYTDGGAGGVGTFRQDTGWTPYSGAVEFDATAPEPGTVAMLLSGIGLLIAGARRKSRA